MARKAREKSSTGMYNIIARSTDVLFKSEEDYNFFVEILNEYISTVYAYALTPDIICMAVKETENGIGMDIKPLITKYARYYNKKYNNEGKIFDGRFKSEPIEGKKALENSKAILSAVVDELGKGGCSSQKSVKKYEMIDFYAKLFGCGVVQKIQKAEPIQKKADPKKAIAEVETNNQPPKQENAVNSEQQRKKLPTWLL